MLFTRKHVVRTKSNPGAVGGGGRPRRTAWCASILLVVTTLVALNTVGVILRSAPERETTDQTYRRLMMARFYRGDPVRESGNQREAGNAIGVSGASVEVELPRRIHIIARNLHDTVYVGAWIRYHPHWNITVWTDDNMLQYMETHATQYLPTYRALIGAKKSDFFRLIVLFMLGGVYADADVEPLQSLEPYLTEHRAPCMFTEEPDLHKVALYDTPTSSVMPCNFILAGVPNAAEHKHLIDVIANIASNQTELKGADATAQTGPGLLRSERGALSACHVAPARLFAGRPADNNPLIVTKCAKVFHSTFDDDYFHYYESNSIFIPEQLWGELRTACCDARDTPLWQHLDKVIPQGSCPPKPNTDDVLTLHHWSHSWNGDKNARRRRL